MKTMLVMLATAAALAFAGATAQAAPAAQVSVGTNPDLILTAGGCGRGWHRGPYGHCVRNMGPGPAYPCWWVRGPYGHWHMVCR